MESSPYRDADARVDLMPLYLYEGERFFLRSNMAGVRVTGDHAAGLELFVERRLEGYPEDETPEVLEGMDTRNSEADVGARYYGELGAHHRDLSVRQDASNNSHGTELRAAYGYLWQDDRWSVQPVLTAAWRSGDLNDYYYGVEAADVTPDRPAYNAGAGLNLTAALYARYRILHNWSLLGGVFVTQWSSEVGDSPLVDSRTQWGGMLGAAYDFGNGQVRWNKPHTPTYVRLFYGRDSDDGCHLVKIMTFQCVGLNDDDYTDIAGLHVGRPFVSGLNGWPLDLFGYAGIVRHLEKGRQQDAWQIDAYMKGYYYGFPWSHRVMTRIGLGFGLSYAERVPYAEVTSQAERERNTSSCSTTSTPASMSASAISSAANAGTSCISASASRIAPASSAARRCWARSMAGPTTSMPTWRPRYERCSRYFQVSSQGESHVQDRRLQAFAGCSIGSHRAAGVGGDRAGTCIAAVRHACHPAPSAVLFNNVRIFDGVAGRLSAPSSVLVRGHLIERIGASAQHRGDRRAGHRRRRPYPDAGPDRCALAQHVRRPAGAGDARRRPRLRQHRRRGGGQPYADARLHHGARCRWRGVGSEERDRPRRRPGSTHLSFRRDDNRDQWPRRFPQHGRPAAHARRAGIAA